MTGRTDDIVEISQTLARYAVTISAGDIEGLIAVFTPDGTYSAFGDVYPLSEFPDLVAAAPKGLFLTGPPAVEFTGEDTATGTQPLCFIDQSTHDMRIGYYKDTYLRTDCRLAAADPGDDLHAAQRRAQLRHPARPQGHTVAVEVSAFRSAGPGVA